MKKITCFFILAFFFSFEKNIQHVYCQNNTFAKDLYIKSIKYAKKQSYEYSIKNILLLDSLYPYETNSKKVHLVIIYCYYKTKKYDLSLFQISTFLNLNPNYKKDYIFYIKGLVYYDQYVNWYLKYFPINNITNDISFAKKSFLSFKYIIKNFSYSKYALDSIQRIIFLKNKMIKYEISISKYYLKKQAYLSAVNRANFIIKNYNKSDNLFPALKILLISYHKSHLINLYKEVKIMTKINK